MIARFPRRRRRACLEFSVAGILAACQQVAGASPDLVLRRSIPLPGVDGRIDHLAYDPATERLFVAALGNGSLEAIDLKQGVALPGVRELEEPQGIVYVPATQQVVVACGGDGTVRAYDASSLAPRQQVDLGDDADNVRLTADGRMLLVGHGHGAIAMLDAATLAERGSIALGGHPESFQLEPDGGRLFVNVPGDRDTGGEVVVLDRTAKTTAAAFRLREAGRNFPMMFDALRHRLYVGCRTPARLMVLDAEAGSVLQALPCVGDADDVFLAPDGARLYVIGGEGAISVFAVTDQGVALAGTVPTAPGARTGLLVAERRALFVAVPKRAGQICEIREYALGR